MSDAGSLCVSCGLCCDGTLFNRAKTSFEEAPRVRSHGLEVYPDETHFALPCPRLDGTACTIYADRFRVCRTFRCKLLRGVDAGEISLDRATALVAEAKRLRGFAQQRDPVAGQAEPRRQRLLAVIDWNTRSDPNDRRTAAAAYLSFVAMERFADAHFRLPPKSPLAPGDGSGEAVAKGRA